MTQRTPRRRISPRTKRRYRAIREFFRRALGSPSQEIKINSSIAVNVTDLKHKIIGLEHQLSEVSRHCRDLASLETSFRHEADSQPPEGRRDLTAPTRSDGKSDRKSSSSTTKVLYKNCDPDNRRSDESDYALKDDPKQPNDRKYLTPSMNSDIHNVNTTKAKKQKSRSKMYGCDPILRKHQAQSAFENFTSTHSASSYHSLAYEQPHQPVSGFGGDHHEIKHSRQREYIEPVDYRLNDKDKKHKEHSKRHKSKSPVKNEIQNWKVRKTKHGDGKLDQDFIADIIKRQYKPVKLFGARECDSSLFSAPVCRDQEYPPRENLQASAELCSCCYEGRARSKYVRDHNLSDMRSICDTRLYSSKRHARPKLHGRHVDVYNDSALYDLIPVKEKSSPKSRRKFVEDNMIVYDYYREVPPSPRTHRPRLNLKAQHYEEYDDYIPRRPHRRHTMKPRKQQEYVETLQSDITSEIVLPRSRREKQRVSKPIKVQNCTQIDHDTTTMSSLQYPNMANEHLSSNIHDSTLNKSQDSDLSEKTDKALCEIKDILQNFLHEIKKDAIPTEKPSQAVPVETTTANIPNSTQASFNNYTPPPCVPPGFMSPFQNPCYSVLPVCPMNCMQNGYLIPSPSITCQACATNTKESTCQDCAKNRKDTAQETSKSKETEELIKEIYKFVAQNPNCCRKKDRRSENGRAHDAYCSGQKVLTSRSVGENNRVSRHDAQVGTLAMKCYSKSCEAIGSRMPSDTYYTSVTRSDTVLEKLSLEAATQSYSDSDISTDITVDKPKKSKFTNVLKSFGIFKKKKDAIEELSESESSIEVDVKPKSPYNQEVMNYMMHGQDYYQPPPMSPYPHRPERPYGYGHPAAYDPRYEYQPPINELYAPHRVHHETIHEHTPFSHYSPERHRLAAPSPPYPNYDPCCSHMQPPLCLKEIEVKSTGTQSERKMSFLRKLAMKQTTMPQPQIRREHPRTFATQTTPKQEPPPPKTGGLLSGWKNLHAKAQAQARAKMLEKEQDAKYKVRQEDPMKFSFNTQKKLAEGDMKMRNAMLKKLFYKRNPFSPRNLIIKTLLGKDKSSYGEPNVTFRPRMFF